MNTLHEVIKLNDMKKIDKNEMIDFQEKDYQYNDETSNEFMWDFVWTGSEGRDIWEFLIHFKKNGTIERIFEINPRFVGDIYHCKWSEEEKNEAMMKYGIDQM